MLTATSALAIAGQTYSALAQTAPVTTSAKDAPRSRRSRRHRLPALPGIGVARSSEHPILPIESVEAEDIGKLPDQNVAEALQRLPGIQIDRSQGQGTSVLIDGLRQNLTTLNGDVFLTGKEFYVSGEASGGGAGGNSQYGSLEGIPSEESQRHRRLQEPGRLDHRRAASAVRST